MPLELLDIFQDKTQGLLRFQNTDHFKNQCAAYIPEALSAPDDAESLTQKPRQQDIMIGYVLFCNMRQVREGGDVEVIIIRGCLERKKYGKSRGKSHQKQGIFRPCPTQAMSPTRNGCSLKSILNKNGPLDALSNTNAAQSSMPSFMSQSQDANGVCSPKTSRHGKRYTIISNNGVSPASLKLF